MPWLLWLLPISQHCYPMQDPYSERLATSRTQALMLLRSSRIQTHPTAAMAIHMVFALLREKLERPEKSLLSSYRLEHRIIGQGRIKEIGLTP